MNLLSLDLEMNQPSSKIIQVGWTVGDPLTGRTYAIEGRYVFLDEPLDKMISNLCGIQQETLDRAGTLQDAYNDLLADSVKYDCSHTTLAWSKGDLALLRKQVPLDVTWPFGQHYIDAKNLYQSWKLKTGADHLKGGLARAMMKFKIPFEGRKHNAKDDAYNTFRIYHRLLQEFK
jgi:inhibitor of KinA sporulation pathway (predicted exonuclease)